MTDSDIKDGYDLLKYPLDYDFKAMCKSRDDVGAESLVQAVVKQVVSDERIGSARSTQSRTGKFTAVTLTVEIRDRDELEQIYKALADSDHIVMTL